MPILDPGIHVQDGYAPYEQGLAQDVFIKDITGKPYTGQVFRISYPHAHASDQYFSQ